MEVSPVSNEWARFNKPRREKASAAWVIVEMLFADAPAIRDIVTAGDGGLQVPAIDNPRSRAILSRSHQWRTLLESRSLHAITRI
jgi:hypothetical protein